MAEDKSNSLSSLGFLVGVGMVVAALIVSRTFVSIKRMEDVISVSGSARQQVTSDSARYSGSFSRTVFKDQIKFGYQQMKNDEAAVKAFFASQGFDNVEVSPVFANEIWKNDNNAPKEYNLVQTIQIKSDDVNKMKELAKNSDKLVEKNVFFSAGPVEYYYSKLADLRISLLPEAIKDAKKRAEAIAGSSDKQVDSIKSVNMGVVQVVQVGSVDVSDYGSYDTSQIEKEVMVTVKAAFNLK